MKTERARRAETYLRLQAERALRLARADELPVEHMPDSEPASIAGQIRKSYSGPHELLGGPDSGQSWLRWLATQAWALADAGAVDDTVAASVIRDLGLALSVRGVLEHLHRHLIGAAQGSSLPAGPMRAVQVGATVGAELDGEPFTIRLGAMLLCPDAALLTMVATPPATHNAPGPGGPLGSMINALRQCPASDDEGASYELSFSGGGSDELWEGLFAIRPAPPDDARWLDVTLPGAVPLRVMLKPALTAQTTSKALPASETAERYVDALTLRLLRHPGAADRGAGRAVVEAVSGLLGAGVLAAESPALGRLAAVSRLDRHLPFPDALPADVPEHWRYLVRRGRARNGPIGVVPFAAVLPTVDGVCCAVLRITSAQRSATIDVYARGWPWRDSYRPGSDDGAFSWTARDDVGGFYVASNEGGTRGSDGEAELALDLRPAINPRARRLQIVLTGKTREVSVTVPLNWQENL